MKVTHIIYFLHIFFPTHSFQSVSFWSCRVNVDGNYSIAILLLTLFYRIDIPFVQIFCFIIIEHFLHLFLSRFEIAEIRIDFMCEREIFYFVLLFVVVGGGGGVVIVNEYVCVLSDSIM